MSSRKADIHVLTNGISTEEYIHVSENLMKRLRIPAHRLLSMKFGSQKFSVTVAPNSRTANSVRLNEQTAKLCGLNNGASIRVGYFPETRTLRLGPVIGVLLPRISASPDRPFGIVTTFYKELHEACQLYGGFVYFFTSEGIHSDYINGLHYVPNRWVRERLPIPDVVYNRLPARKLENKSSVQQFIRDVKSRHNGFVFNEKFLDKNDVFSALGRDAAIRRFLPESYLFRNYEQLSRLSGRYASVFLKPVTGSLGKGIIRLSRHSQQIICQYASVNGSIKKSYPSLPKAFSAIKPKIRNKRFLIQQGLTLITIHNRPVDFRALMHKGYNGKWGITSIVGRIARNQSFVSNLARGGTLSPTRGALLKSNLPARFHKSSYATLHKAAMEIASSIETNIPYHFGELGIDLAVDIHGHVWLLEVNSKPAKNDDTPLSEGKIRPSAKKIVQYCRHLAGL